MRAIWSRHDWDGDKRLRKLVAAMETIERERNDWDGNSWEGEIDLEEEKDEGTALRFLDRSI
jgi:hypothetical protein